MPKLLTALLISLSVLPLYAHNGSVALHDSLLRVITGATISSHQVEITRFGARGDSATDCRRAFDKAMKYAQKRGGARIVVPAGTWLVKGPIHMVSNVCLDIKEGATLKFVATPQNYLPVVSTSWEATPLWNYSPFIYAKGCRNIAIVGRGVIDGNSAETFAKWHDQQAESQELSRRYNHEGTPVSERRFGEGHCLRPQLIQFYDCSEITIADVFIRHSPFWCVHLLCSENIICRGLRYDAKLENNDGIDPESSRNILIEDIHFDNGDDNVAIKSGRDNDGWKARPSENIIIRNCKFKGLHGVVIGSEMSGGVQNIFIENCTYAGYCKRGIFIKTNPDRGGFIRNVYVNNCMFGEVLDLFYVTSMYAGQGLANHHYSTIENIFVDSLSAREVKGTALVLQGTQAKPIRNVSFRHVHVGVLKKGISFENTEPVLMQDCFLGPRVGVPSMVSAKDKIFDHDNH